MSSANMISTLFGNEKFSIIADSKEFLGECERLGFYTDHISELKNLPKNSIIFSFSNDAAKMTFELAKKTENKKSIFCATQVFEPSVANALYSLKLLLSSNFEHALNTQRSVLNMLNSNESFGFSGNEANAQVTLLPHAQPYALLTEDVSGNFIQSVAEFF
ncbi:hypothetical protein ACQKP7_04340 [Pseudomonas frederiksbergensis]|uniref:hypothetical protein n=1 Tax=Pseudomonas frederiksbergensis TaxID=104087 RepID=UPI003D02CB88